MKLTKLLLCLFFVLGSCKDENTKIEIQDSSELFSFFSAEFMSAASDLWAIKTDRESKGEELSLLWDINYDLDLAEFLVFSSKVSRGIWYSSYVDRSNLDSLKYLANRITEYKIPFTYHFKLEGIKHNLNNLNHGIILSSQNRQNYIRFFVMIDDFITEHKSDCALDWYDDRKNTGSMLLSHPNHDDVRIMHSAILGQREDFEVLKYDSIGNLLSRNIWKNVDSIIVKKQENLALVEINYLTKYGFRDYIKIDRMDKSEMHRIYNSKYDSFDVNEWMENYIDRILYDETVGYDRVRDEVFDNRDQFKFYSEKEYNVDSIRSRFDRIRLYERDYGKMVGVNWESSEQNIGEYKWFVKFLKEKDSINNGRLNKYQFFWYYTIALRTLGYYGTYCWGCGPSPTNERFGLCKIKNDKMYYFTEAIYVFGPIYDKRVDYKISEYPLSEWEREFDNLNFPIPSVVKKKDGSPVSMDSLRKENLYFYSTN